MNKEIFNCQLQAEDIAEILQITNETAIMLIANRLEIAYITGQADFIKDTQRKSEDKT